MATDGAGMLLTPPSAHQRVVQQNASEKRAAAAERREHVLAAQLAQERVRARECRRQQLQLAQQERESYLAQARAFFDMAPLDQVFNKQDKPERVVHCCVVPVPRPTYDRQAAGSSSSWQSSHSKRPISAKVSGSRPQPGWSEVSTAAPSTVGEEDPVESCMTPVERDIGSKLSASLRAWLNRAEDGRSCEEHLSAPDKKIPEEMESSNSLQQLETALAGEIKAGEVGRDPLDETLSSSDEEAPPSQGESELCRAEAPSSSSKPAPQAAADGRTKPGSPAGHHGKHIKAIGEPSQVPFTSLRTWWWKACCADFICTFVPRQSEPGMSGYWSKKDANECNLSQRSERPG